MSTDAIAQIDELARVLGIDHRQRRLQGDKTIAIAGTFGAVRPSHSGDSVLLVFRVHNHLNDEVRRLLSHRGIMTRLATGIYELGRMPADQMEKDAIADLLGLLDRRRAA